MDSASKRLPRYNGIINPRTDAKVVTKIAIIFKDRISFMMLGVVKLKIWFICSVAQEQKCLVDVCNLSSSMFALSQNWWFAGL